MIEAIHISGVATPVLLDGLSTLNYFYGVGQQIAPRLSD
jgi:hypothetical protein